MTVKSIGGIVVVVVGAMVVVVVEVVVVPPPHCIAMLLNTAPLSIPGVITRTTYVPSIRALPVAFAVNVIVFPVT